MNPNRTSNALSEGALKKAVLQKALGSRIFQYPFWAIVGLLGVGFIFGFNFWLVVACILLGGLSAVSWIVQVYLKGDKTKMKYIQYIKEMTEKQIAKQNDQLKESLCSVNLRDGAIQLEQFQNSFKNFIFILDQKFNPEELAYNRYYTIVQQIVLGGMNNLQTIFLKKRNLLDANLKETQKTLATLQKNANPSLAQQNRISELVKRLSIYEEENREIEELLAQNEKALTGIDNVSRSIANINTDGSRTTDMENAMDELMEMTEFAKVLDSNYTKAIKV